MTRVSVHLFVCNRRGLRPTISAAERLAWCVNDRVAQLECFPQINRAHGDIPPVSPAALVGLLECAKRTNPAQIQDMQRDYQSALQYELRRYSNVAAVVCEAREEQVAA